MKRGFLGLSTPSLGITDGDLDEHFDECIDFQLPLSGSRDHIFERLEDELLAAIRLSTPSLGITWLSHGVAIDYLVSAFNSLSRDHEMWIGSLRREIENLTFNSLSRDHEFASHIILAVAHRPFQLPLSGSQTEKYRLHVTECPNLSTPSLGITGLS